MQYLSISNGPLNLRNPDGKKKKKNLTENLILDCIIAFVMLIAMVHFQKEL